MNTVNRIADGQPTRITKENMRGVGWDTSRWNDEERWALITRWAQEKGYNPNGLSNDEETIEKLRTYLADQPVSSLSLLETPSIIPLKPLRSGLNIVEPAFIKEIMRSLGWDTLRWDDAKLGEFISRWAQGNGYDLNSLRNDKEALEKLRTDLRHQRVFKFPY
jgi:hypothetical protein